MANFARRRRLGRTASKWLVGAGVVGAVALVLWWAGLWQPLWELFSDRERMRQVVEGFGPLAPAVFVLLLVAQAVLAPCRRRPWRSRGATSSVPSGASS